MHLIVVNHALHRRDAPCGVVHGLHQLLNLRRGCLGGQVAGRVADLIAGEAFEVDGDEVSGYGDRSNPCGRRTLAAAGERPDEQDGRRRSRARSERSNTIVRSSPSGGKSVTAV